MTAGLIEPDWPAPPRVRALSTTRLGGVSRGPFASFNLADHVGDDPAAVAENRRRLRRSAGLPAEPAWLRQVHGVDVLDAGRRGAARVEADAAITGRPGVVCGVLTADCLPVLFASLHRPMVAAAHAGWRGLAAGILEAVMDRLGQDPAGLTAWIGPGIGPEAFEVGPEVRELFVAADQGAASCFVSGAADRWLADLAGLARRRLAAAGLRSIHGAGLCTHADPDHFFSHRRDGRCGRMASLIWLEAPSGA